MRTKSVVANGAENLAELVHQLGDIPLYRIRTQPPPGTATERDVIAAGDALDKRLCELIDGVLVEKDMGMLESVLAGIILHCIHSYLDEVDLGFASGADGGFYTVKGKIRFPDVALFTWKTLGTRKIPKDKISRVAADLAVEVVSEGNTRAEIDRKLKEYFCVGVKLAWVVYPKTQSARIYSTAVKFKRITSKQSLTCEGILPGFALPLATLFKKVEKSNNQKKSK